MKKNIQLQLIAAMVAPIVLCSCASGSHEGQSGQSVTGASEPAVRPVRSSGGVPGYVNSVLPESEEARKRRHERVAERRSGTPIMVHRGTSKFAPENTIEAYATAMDLGADGIEIDIRRSADGVLYLLHDDTLDRVTPRQGSVKGLSYFELLKCGLKTKDGKVAKGIRIPTLAATVELVRQRASLLHLDIKEPGLEDEITRLFEEADIWDHVVQVNGGNASKLVKNPKIKQLPYKGWVPESGDQPDWDAIEAFLKKEGTMVFCRQTDDPAIMAKALNRKPGEPVALPGNIRVPWSKNGIIRESMTRR